MSRSMWLVLCSLTAVMMVSGCKTTQAPVSATGSKIEISILSYRGDPNTMESKQWGWRNEVGEFMEPDLVNQLNRAGYSAKLIKSKSEYQAGEGKYLLNVKIKSYNPGSSAARMLVGYGAGAAALDTQYVLFDSSSKQVLSWDDGVGTSQHWTRLPRKLNSNTVRKLNEHFAASQ